MIEMESNKMLEKVFQVSNELCTGCGSCVDACSAGAIHLVDHQAEIDETLCTSCEACLNACPNGAIIAITAPVYTAPIMVHPVAVPGLALGQQSAALPETKIPVRGLKPLSGAALVFLGSEVAPRLVDVVVDTLERRLARPTSTTVSPVSTSTQVRTTGGRCERKQVRYRSGRTGNRNHKGRR